MNISPPNIFSSKTYFYGLCNTIKMSRLFGLFPSHLRSQYGMSVAAEILTDNLGASPERVYFDYKLSEVLGSLMSNRYVVSFGM